MLDQLFLGAVSERIQMLLQISPGALRSRSDRHGFAAKVIRTWLHFVDVWSLVIVPGHQQSHTERTPIVALGAGLHLVPDVHDQSGHRIDGVVRELVVQTFLAHIATQHAGISGDSGNRDAQMGVDRDDLLLVGGQLGGGSLQGDQHGMIASLQANGGRAQFHRFHGVFHLMEATLGAPDGHIAVVLVAKLCRTNKTNSD